MKHCTARFGAVLAVVATLGVAQAKTIVVNTENNADFSAGKTNLVRAISLLADGDTINFNIPGGGVHYLLTPVDGYPLITNSSVTLDGYSQPGAVPNSNPIHAANNAQIKIVLSSTNGNGMAIRLAAEAAVGHTFARPGFNNNDNVILGFFRGTNNWVKGFCFQGVCGPAESFYNGNAGPLMGIGFMADDPDTQPWPDANGGNWHVSGCWFGLNPANGQPVYMPDGKLATPIHGLDMERHRNNAQTKVNYAQPGVLGVAANSPNPRAEFNVILTPVAAVLTGLNYRLSGNFFNVLPDGMSNFDIAYMADATTILNSGNADAMVIIARQGDNMVIGTDGNGVNDDQEGNVFGGTSAYPFNNPAFCRYRCIDAFYGPSPSTPAQGTNNIIAGNYFGVAIDGVTRFTNSAPIRTGFATTGDTQIGSDFDGVSDALEGNVICNNYPFSTHFLNPGGTDATPEATLEGRAANSQSQGFSGINTGARVSFRGNVTIGNDLLPYKFANPPANSLPYFTNYSAPYLDVNSAAGLIPVLTPTNIFPRLTGAFPIGINGYTTVVLDIYELDPEGWANGKLFAEPELSDLSTYTNGFPQGKRYLGSVTVPNTGFFDINLPASAGVVTVTANYSKDAAGAHKGRVHTSNFSMPAYVLPGGAASVGLTQVVTDVACWFDTTIGTNGGVTNGPIILANQPAVATLGNWEPYVSALGDSTFLVEFNTFANDGTYINQNNAVAKQPAAGGPAKVDYAFYADNGQPFKAQLNLSRQNGNPGKVAGDLRYGADKFITMAEASLGQLPEFQTVARWGNNNIYQGTDRYPCEQIFSLNPITLAQTPQGNAWDYHYGPFVGVMGAGNNAPQVGRTGGRPNFLDNGNIVVMWDDRSSILNTDNELVSFSIMQPNGTQIKTATLASLLDIFDNMCAVKGGFVIRAHGELLFYNNAGTLMFSNNVVSSGMNFGGSADTGGRGDGIRIGGDIRSSYVFVAGTINGGGGSAELGVAAWDVRTGQFVGGAVVTDGDPTVEQSDRASVAVDALNRVCVVWAYKPDRNVFGYQIAARVAQFDGKNFNWQTHTFYPFVNHDQDPNNVLGFSMVGPTVAMNTRQICVAAKGYFNNVNNAAAGPNSLSEQTVYTVVSHPAPVAAPQPTVAITKSGSNLNLNWDGEAGLFTVQTRSSLSSGGWANATAGNVAPPVSIPAGNGPLFVRLAR